VVVAATPDVPVGVKIAIVGLIVAGIAIMLILRSLPHAQRPTLRQEIVTTQQP
jgi:hypothetical protein